MFCMYIYIYVKYSCVIFIIKTKTPLFHMGEKETVQWNPKESREVPYKIIGLNYFYRRVKIILASQEMVRWARTSS